MESILVAAVAALLLTATAARQLPAASAAGAAGLRIGLSHVDSKGNFTELELACRAIARDNIRARRILARAETNASVLVYPAGVAYVMDIAIGTPPVHFYALADTGSDLVWTRCAACDSCGVNTTYNPAASTSFDGACRRSRGCFYNATYGKGSTTGILATETFTLGYTAPVAIPGIQFGCSNWTSSDFDGFNGIVGLGRGSLSLVNQLGATRFCYCLTSISRNDEESPMFIGAAARLTETAGVIQTIPFVPNNNSKFSNHYYVPLNGVSLGSRKLAIDPAVFALHPDGTGGVIIDSGTTYTLLDDAVFTAVGKGVQSFVTGLRPVTGSRTGPFEYCYDVTASSVPASMPPMVLHFGSADMVLPASSYMRLFSKEKLWCLAMAKASSGFPQILGVYQQQNMHILYDLSADKLSFTPANCSAL